LAPAADAGARITNLAQQAVNRHYKWGFAKLPSTDSSQCHPEHCRSVRFWPFAASRNGKDGREEAAPDYQRHCCYRSAMKAFSGSSQSGILDAPHSSAARPRTGDATVGLPSSGSTRAIVGFRPGYVFQSLPIRFRDRAREHQMDFISDVVINLLAHRIGRRVLAFLSNGRFKGERGLAWGFAVAVGGLVLLAPIVALFAWFIRTG